MRGLAGYIAFLIAVRIAHCVGNAELSHHTLIVA
jgi:hypothetical protein